MGNGAHGAVPQGARLGRPAGLPAVAVLLAGLLFQGARCASAAGAGDLPAPLTVYAGTRPAHTVLRLQPGFATVMRADRRIDAVAVGDPRLVAVATVRRGADVYDLVLQPQTEAGATNMVVWFGPLTTAWHLEIGPGPRTADLVFIVTIRAGLPPEGPPAASPSTQGPPAGQVSSGPARAASQPSSEQGPPAAPRQTAAGSPEAAAPGSAAPGSAPGGRAPAFLETRQSVQAVEAVFRAQRAPEGVLIRYRITNGTGADLVIRPAGVLVRADGHPAPYAVARESVDRGRPDVLPRGATETGMIDTAGAGIRRVQLIVTLTPAAATAARDTAPIILQATFTGLDSLAVSPAP